MDAFDLFKKLGSGAKFNFKRFHDDAHKLKIPHSLPQRTSLSRPDALKAQTEPTSDDPPCKKPKLDEDEDESSDEEDSAPEAETELQLLGSIRSAGDDIVQNKKKKDKKSKKLTAKKRAQIQQEQVNHCRNQNHIHVHGTDIPDPVVTFDQLSDDYKLHPRIIENLRKVGYEDPTPIQMQAVPVMLHRREILACAPTGSGKTASFILPILHHLKEPRKQGFRALVLAPTRELAKQTHQWFTRLSEGLGFRIHYIEKVATAEKKFGPKSSQKFDILVTTPNRLIYMLQQDPPVINLDSVEWLVVDESDKLFEEGKRGFRDQLAAIYKACQGSKVRRAMFSATFAHQVEEWCKLNLDNVVQVYIGARNVATETIKQELVFVGTEAGKLLAVRDIIKKGIQPPVLVFVQSKERAKELFSELIYDGINVDVIHADRTQLQRDNTVKSFRTGQIWVLICTELMGRGIDFQGVNLVINYDFPNSAISYIHRIGRTGRAGRQGRAVTFFTEDDSVNLRSIANIMREAGCPVPEYMLQMKRPSKKVRRKLAKNVPKREKIATSSKFDLKRNQMKRNKANKKKSKSQAPQSPSATSNSAGSGHLGKENGTSSSKKKRADSGVKQTSSSKKGKKKKKRVSEIET